MTNPLTPSTHFHADPRPTEVGVMSAASEPGSHHLLAGVGS